MRVWIDLTNSPHVLVMRPVIERLRADGHEVRVTARDFAQTIELCERFGIDHIAIGRHRGERLAAKAGGLASRSSALVRWALADARAAGGRRFDIALGHGSNDVSVAAAAAAHPLRDDVRLRVGVRPASPQLPSRTRCRRARRDPAGAPATATAPRARSAPTRASRRSTTSPTSSPTPRSSTSSASTPTRPIVVVRTPPEVSLYHRFENDLFAGVLARLRDAAAAGVQPVVLPRTDAQRAELRRVRRLRRPRPRDRRPVADRLRRPRDLAPAAP